MTEPPPPPGPDNPFAVPRVKTMTMNITVEEALAAAAAAGFRPTPRSRTNAAHVQRDWNSAATIRPVPGGVVIKGAWTNQQIVGVVAVLFVLLFGLVCV